FFMCLSFRVVVFRCYFFFQAEDGIRDFHVTGVQTCALPILAAHSLGIGGYWATPGLINHLGPFLNLAGNQKCVGLFYLGHHESEAREPVRSPIEEKVRWED